MRGKGHTSNLRTLCNGITPAYAGKRQFCPPAGRTDKDHPRMCGEKMMKAGSNCAMLGSPPRMRGKVHCSSARTAAAGITPAYAGKSSEHTQRSGTSGDHPRVCGEKFLSTKVVTPEAGSPPRMRGKAQDRQDPPRGVGITPAYAGKSSVSCPSSARV